MAAKLQRQSKKVSKKQQKKPVQRVAKRSFAASQSAAPAEDEQAIDLKNLKVEPEKVVPINRLPKRKYIEAQTKQLLNNVTKAKTDPYGPSTFQDKFKQASFLIPQFEDVIKHPMATPERKKELISQIFGHLKADVPTTNFFTELAVDSKLGLAKDIVGRYKRAAAEQNKDSLATVTSAAPLSQAQVDQITKSLQAVVTPGNKLRVFQHIDPSILGGFIVQMDEIYQDLSMVSAYRQLEQQVIDATSV
jgi:F-type H+-transporting ATPase subunit O